MKSSENYVFNGNYKELCYAKFANGQGNGWYLSNLLDLEINVFPRYLKLHGFHAVDTVY